MRITTCGLLLTACSLLGCQHEQPTEQISVNESLLIPKPATFPATTEFETESPWPPTYAFQDEDSATFTYGQSKPDWDTTYIDKQVFTDHDLRVRIVMAKEKETEMLHAIRIERLGREGFQNNFMFRAPHELPRLLYLLSKAYDTCLTLKDSPGTEKYITKEVTQNKIDSGFSHRPAMPPPHQVIDQYKKLADFTMQGRRVRLHERVGQNVLFADLVSTHLFTQNGEQFFRVDDPVDIKTSEDLLNVIRLFNAAYDQSMQHLRRATPAMVASSE